MRDLADRFAEAISAREDLSQYFHPDGRIENVETAVTDATYVGPEGVNKWAHDVLEAMDENARFEFAKELAVGDDYLVCVCRFVGRGAGSGVPLDLRWPAVLRARDGKLTSAVGYRTKAEALEAVGLAPS